MYRGGLVPSSPPTSGSTPGLTETNLSQLIIQDIFRLKRIYGVPTKHFAWFLAPLAVLLVVGCTNPSDNKDDAPSYKTVLWEENEDNELQLYTNDPTNFGSTYWKVSDADCSSGTMTIVRVEGNPFYGSGMVFGWQDNDNFSFVLVDQEGWYFVGSRIEGEFVSRKDWTNSDALWTGLGEENIINVVVNEDGSCSITFNGDTSSTFEIPAGPNPFEAGAVGPIGVIGPETSDDGADFNESLPVDVRASGFEFIEAGQAKVNSSRSLDLGLVGHAALSISRR